VNAALWLAARAGAVALLFAAPLACVAGSGGAGAEHAHGDDPGHAHALPAQRPSAYDAAAMLDAARRALPPPPAGTTDLAFRELFAPIGRRGLAYSEKARGLDGRRVRMLGYMVGQDAPADGMLLLAPYPFQLHETEYGLAEDLPAATVHVIVPDRAGRKVPYTPGLLLLTGRLELGPREEPDGRVSTVRLVLDPASAARAVEEQHASAPHSREEKHR
jgi:hypothetical protein